MTRLEGDSHGLPGGAKAALAVVVAALVAIGVALLIGRAAGFTSVRHEITAADERWFVVCFLAEVAAFGAYAVVLRYAISRPTGPELGLGLSVVLTFASLGATRVIAAAGAGGFAVTFWFFRRAGHATSEALVRVVGMNTLVYLAFGVGAWVAALLATIGIFGDAPLTLTAPWLAIIPACLVAARYVTNPGRVDRLTRREGSLFRRSLAYGIGGTAWVRAVLGNPDARAPVAGTALYWVGDVACLWAALHSIGHPLPLAELAIAYATGYAATVLPLPFGGVGGVEAAMTYALTAVGLPLAPALVAVAVYRLFGFWVPTIPAVGALLLLPRAGRELEAAAMAEAPAS